MVGGGLQEGGFEFQILHCHILQKGISEIVYSFHALAWKWKGESNERGERPRKEKASRIKNWSIKNLWRLHTAQRHPYAFKWGHYYWQKRFLNPAYIHNSRANTADSIIGLYQETMCTRVCQIVSPQIVCFENVTLLKVWIDLIGIDGLPLKFAPMQCLPDFSVLRPFNAKWPNIWCNHRATGWILKS